MNFKIKPLRILLIVGFIIQLSWTGLNAQIYLENEAIFNEAEEYLAGEEYEEALPLFLILENKGLLNPNVSYKIGLCYLSLADEAGKSIPYLEMAANNTSLNYRDGFNEITAPIESVLLLARAFHYTGSINRAIPVYEKYKTLTKIPGQLQLADFYLKQCRVAVSYMEHPSEVEYEMVNDNSTFSIYNPVLMNKERMLYMERRKFYDAFVSSELVGDTMSISTNHTSEIGSDGNMILAGSNSNGNKFIFVGYEAGSGYELFHTSVNIEGKWKKLQKFDSPVNSAYNEKSACFITDSIIVFSSNRPGGIGGQDLYSTQLNENDQWLAPVNLGLSINSPFDDENPLYSEPNSALYFSSKGHQNMGGYDFFCSEYTKLSGWAPANNMGFPVSTTADDLFLFPTDKRTVFYTDRVRNGREQLNKFVRLNIASPIPQRKVLISGELGFSDSVPARIVDYFITDNSEQKKVYESQTTSSGAFSFMLPPGDFTLQLNHSPNINASRHITLDNSGMIDELILDTPEWIILDQEEYLQKPLLVLHNILFDFSSTQLAAAYKPMLDSLASMASSDKSVSLIISGHSDAIGSQNINMQLSKKRAEVVIDYLVSKGLPNNRLQLYSFGESKPIALNESSDSKDLPEGRKYNRRVEIELRGESQIEVKKVVPIPENLKTK